MLRIKTGSRAFSGLWWLLLTLCLWQGGVSALAADNITATVDRTAITEFDVLTLRVRTSDQLVDLAPDFSRVGQDFQILSTQTSQSSSFSITNGSTTSVVYKDYILSLKPKRLGTLTIPAITLGGANTVPISIRVTKQSAAARQQMNQLVFFETDVDTRESYVQGQIIYRLKLFYTEGTTGQFPLPPVLDNAIVEVIENEKRYSSIVNGKEFFVIERRIAVFPQRSGTLVIPGETFVGTFNTGGFRSQARRVNAASEPHTITVNRVPPSFSGADWIPARSLVVTESWRPGSETPSTIRVGEPINRVLTLTAVGLSDSLLPPLSDLSVPNAKVYSDPPSTEKQIGTDGITAVQTTTTSILPTEVGELTLPEVRIPWWNIVADKEEVAILPATTWQVLPAAGIGVLAPPGVTVPGAEPGQPTPEAANPVWQYLALALGLLWLVSTWQWFSLRREVKALKSAGTTRHSTAFNDPDEAAHYKAFTRACLSNQAATAHRQLFLWAKARYPHLHALNDLPQQAPPGNKTSLANEIQNLEALLYNLEEQADGSLEEQADGSADHKTTWQSNNLATLITELRDADKATEKPGALAAGLNPV